MRTYGRDPDTKKWIVIETDAAGFNDMVYVTALIQAFKLNLNESPFWGNYGIPAKPSVVQQIFPDYYVAFLQRAFSPQFASLIVAKEPSDTPTYRVNITTHQGVRVIGTIAV